MQGHNSRKAAVPYAWVTVIVLFVGLVASFGMRSTFGAYVSPWEQEFSANRALVTSISMMGFVFYALGQPLAGKLNDHFGRGIIPCVGLLLTGTSLILASQATQMWHLFVLFGAGVYLGAAACSNVVSAAIVTKWFVKKRGFALGLVMSGMAAGQLFLIPANLFVIERFGWRTSTAVFGIAILALIVPLVLIFLRSKPEEKGLKPYGHEETKNGNHPVDAQALGANQYLPLTGAFKTRAFWLLAIPFFICGFTDVGLINTHFIPMAIGRGFQVSEVAIAVSLIAITNVAGSIITGYLSDHISRKWQLAAIYTIRAGTFIFLLLLQSTMLLFVFAMIYGAVEIASITPVQSLTVQFFDKYSTGAILGFVSMSHQLGGAIGAWVPGLLYDLTGSYFHVLVVATFMLVGGGLLSLRIAEPRRS